MPTLPEQKLRPRVIPRRADLMRRNLGIVSNSPPRLPIRPLGPLAHHSDIVPPDELPPVLDDGVGVVAEGLGEVVVVDCGCCGRGQLRFGPALVVAALDGVRRQIEVVVRKVDVDVILAQLILESAEEDAQEVGQTREAWRALAAAFETAAVAFVVLEVLLGKVVVEERLDGLGLVGFGEGEDDVVLGRVDTVRDVAAGLAARDEALERLPVFIDDRVVGLAVEVPDVDGAFNNGFVGGRRWETHVWAVAVPVSFVVQF